MFEDVPAAVTSKVLLAEFGRISIMHERDVSTCLSGVIARIGRGREPATREEPYSHLNSRLEYSQPEKRVIHNSFMSPYVSPYKLPRVSAKTVVNRSSNFICLDPVWQVELVPGRIFQA